MHQTHHPLSESGATICGLVGVAGHVTISLEEVFETLLIVDAVRGKHSTGAAMISSVDTCRLVKKVGNPYNLLYSKEYNEAKRLSLKALLGHNRYATLGKIDEDNAHPFVCGHIIGMHNGTLNWNSDVRPEKDRTDSEAIFQSIADIGVEATIPLLCGAWALVWYDMKAKTLNMIRNKERPLFYTYTDKRDAIVWASEQRMIDFALIKTKRAEEDAIFSPGENTLFTWDLSTTYKALGAPVQTELHGKPDVAKSWKNGGWEEQYGNFLGYGKGKKNNQSVITLPAPKDRRGKFRPPYTDLYGKVLNKAEFYDVTNEGCSFCGQSHQNWGTEIHILGRFMGKNTAYICASCGEDDDIFDVFKHSA